MTSRLLKRGDEEDEPLIRLMYLGNKKNLEEMRKKVDELKKKKQEQLMKESQMTKVKEPEPVKEKGPTKKQESAIKKLEKLKDDKIISSTDFKTVKKAILKNRSAKIYAEKLVFEFKGLKNKGTGLDSDLVVKCGKGLYSDDDSSSSSNEDLVNFEDLPDISTMEIKEDEWRGMTTNDITFRYHLLKAYCENASDNCELPEEPEQGGLSDSAYKTKLKSFYKKVIKKPEVRILMQEAKEEEETRPRGRGVKAKKPSKDSIHIDINSHNVRDGKYMMGDGLLDNLDDMDIAKIRSLMPTQSKPRNILEGIEQKDISKLFKTMESAREGQAGQKQSIEYARQALKERMARESKVPKVDRRFTVPKSSIDLINEKAKKARQTIKKPKAKPVRKSMKGSTEMKDRMERLRALKKK